MPSVPFNPVLARYDMTSILLWVGALIAAVVVLTVVLVWVRRVMMGAEQSRVSAAGMMEQLREMRDRGEMSSAEFESIRAKMADKVRRELHERPKATSEKPVNEDAAAILLQIERSGTGLEGEGRSRTVVPPRLPEVDFSRSTANNPSIGARGGSTPPSPAPRQPLPGNPAAPQQPPKTPGGSERTGGPQGTPKRPDK